MAEKVFLSTERRVLYVCLLFDSIRFNSNRSDTILIRLRFYICMYLYRLDRMLLLLYQQHRRESKLTQPKQNLWNYLRTLFANLRFVRFRKEARAAISSFNVRRRSRQVNVTVRPLQNTHKNPQSVKYCTVNNLQGSA